MLDLLPKHRRRGRILNVTAIAWAICASIEGSQNSEGLPLACEAGTNAAHLNCGGMKSAAEG